MTMGGMVRHKSGTGPLSGPCAESSKSGGQLGIRTPDTVARTPDFESATTTWNLKSYQAPRVFSGIWDDDGRAFPAGSAPAEHRNGTNPAQIRRIVCARLVARAYAAVRR